MDPTNGRLLLFLSLGVYLSSSINGEKHSQPRRDFTWPDRQLNVLLDTKSLNKTESQILTAMLDQIEHRTCVTINRLSSGTMNAFLGATRLSESDQNFMYIFKSHFEPSNNGAPALGLSTFGCAKQGRQSLVLTNVAFQWPELVLRYHILRSLAVPGIERPEKELSKLLRELPSGQRIGDGQVESSDKKSVPTYAGYATITSQLEPSSERRIATNKPEPLENEYLLVEYLSEQDLDKIKRLYNCSDYQNRLSPKPLNDIERKNSSSLSVNELHQNPANNSMYNRELKASEAVKDILRSLEDRNRKLDLSNDTMVERIAKSIVHYMLTETGYDMTTERVVRDSGSSGEETTSTSEPNIASLLSQLDAPRDCKPMESCPMLDQQQSVEHERPMIMKLDPYHAQDPQLLQANQVKLSQVNNGTIATYRLMEAPSFPQPADQSVKPTNSNSRSEMLISFEQNQLPATNPVAALASSQVLKLCSCSCQTMTPTSDPPPSVPVSSPVPEPSGDYTPTESSRNSDPWTEGSVSIRPSEMPSVTRRPSTTIEPVPATSPLPWNDKGPDPAGPWPTELPSIPDLPGPVPEPTQNPSSSITSLTTSFPTTPSINTTVPDYDEWPEYSTKLPTGSPPPSKRPQETSLPPSASSLGPGQNACSQVQWVKPSKKVYTSPNIVWDVDRGNQNYFLCNKNINGELVPGKTNLGHSCQVGSNGKAHELQDFQVLTKPEKVNLAWVKPKNDSSGRSKFPVIGGYSRQQEPYMVGRCLVRDENSVAIPLIGFINSKGVGYFPFSDIQIECNQYDVLVCVN